MGRVLKSLVILALISATAAQIRKGETLHEEAVHVREHEDASHDRFEARLAAGYHSPERAIHMYPMTNDQFNVVYDILSFSLACMMSTTVFLFMRVPSVAERYKTALIISGLVTFIAAYHYIRIFNSWVEAYKYPTYEQADRYIRNHELGDGVTGFHGPAPDYHIHHKVVYGVISSPVITGVPFNDAYRYMDWLLTVPLLLMEIVLVMNLPKEESNSKCWVLGVGSALMIVSGYKGELIVAGDLTPRWHSWCLSMCFFLYVVYVLLIGLSDATNSEADPVVKGLIQNVQLTTVVSWCTYPIVYLFPMLHIGGAHAVLAIQIGYCCSDIISKCGVGLMIYQITITKSNNERSAKLLG